MGLYDDNNVLIPFLMQCLFRVNPTDRFGAQFVNFIFFAHLPIYFQPNLNTNTELLSLIVPTEYL